MKGLESVTYEPALVDAKHAGLLCNVSRSTFIEWDSAGLCPRSIKMGGHRLWAWLSCPGREEFEKIKHEGK